MTTYYKQLDNSGKILMLLTYDFTPNIVNPLVVEITEEEYDSHIAEILAANQTETDPDEISDTEALNIIVGGVGL